ncbi:hypothetical protein BDV96DRAFT_593099 [Lophiotrema nucula]|uniref:F-box domain-containing protein n=1 Tax=Lophiotrema nucula TaxID=690887 RepID=A0A6A5ZUB9_9PLEO|nr:hypothetical protein BDV96DRAFT_593099 [Lophiotrema nucula]
MVHNFDYASIPGLQKLNRLTMDCSYFNVDKALYTLPCLRHITLGSSHKGFVGDAEGIVETHVESLEIWVKDSTFAIDWDQKWDHHHLPGVYKCFPALKHICVEVQNIWDLPWTMFFPKADYFINVVDQLRTFGPSLQTLRIDIPDGFGCEFLERTQPLSSLCDFTTLRHLGLPQAAIPDVTVPENIPPSLETLQIYCVTDFDKVLLLIKQLVLECTSLPLREVEFHVREEQEYVLEQWQFQWKRSTILADARDKGVKFRFYDQGSDVGIQWERGD